VLCKASNFIQKEKWKDRKEEKNKGMEHTNIHTRGPRMVTCVCT